MKLKYQPAIGKPEKDTQRNETRNFKDKKGTEKQVNLKKITSFYVLTF